MTANPYQSPQPEAPEIGRLALAVCLLLWLLSTAGFIYGLVLISAWYLNPVPDADPSTRWGESIQLALRAVATLLAWYLGIVIAVASLLVFAATTAYWWFRQRRNRRLALLATTETVPEAGTAGDTEEVGGE